MTTLRIQLTVISLKMSVRFPCSLSFRFDSGTIKLTKMTYSPMIPHNLFHSKMDHVTPIAKYPTPLP